MFNPTEVVAHHQIWPRVPLSTSIADSPDLTPMQFVDVVCQVILVNNSRAPRPVALHFLPDTPNNAPQEMYHAEIGCLLQELHSRRCCSVIGLVVVVKRDLHFLVGY